MTQFRDLGLIDTILHALAHEGYEAPTPIQAQAIPPLLAGKDLLGIAQTGTGKTAAFALPILNRLLGETRRPAPHSARALVLAPTRELAAQIGESFRAYGRFARLSVGVIVGGVAHGPQVSLLSRGLDVLVGTPGRLLDHIGSGKLRLSATRIVVLDEADHMLDLGFLAPIRKILAHLPEQRQNLFFSATMPREIVGLAGEMLRDPVQVSVAPVSAVAERVQQQVFLIESARKRDFLSKLLQDPDMSRAVVFTRTKRGADRVARHLESVSVEAAAIHGDKSQSQRTRALEGFRGGRVRVLVATDIAARGIDIDGVTHVINYELPETPEAYVHRIGRTARAGASGRAISLCDNAERQLLQAIEKLTRQTLSLTDHRTAPHESADAATIRSVKRAQTREGGRPGPAGRRQRKGAQSQGDSRKAPAQARSRPDSRPLRRDAEGRATLS